MEVPSRLFDFNQYHYEVAHENKDPNLLDYILGAISGDVYFIRRIPKSGPLDEGPTILHYTEWKSPYTGKTLFDWLDPPFCSYEVLYFNSAEEAKSVIQGAMKNKQGKKGYEPSSDSVFNY